MTITDDDAKAEETARRFHEAYERLAPSFGYETRTESRAPWEQVPAHNRALMKAVCAEVLRALLDEREALKAENARLEGELARTGVWAHRAEEARAKQWDRLTAERDALAADNARLRDERATDLHCIASMRAQIDRIEADYERACQTIAEMHAAAVGEVRGPKRGVVEDVRDRIAQLEGELANTQLQRDAFCVMSEALVAVAPVLELAARYNINGAQAAITTTVIANQRAREIAARRSDSLRPLTPEELANAKPVTHEKLQAALDEGRRDMERASKERGT
jgi:hypothetical protein